MLIKVIIIGICVCVLNILLRHMQNPFVILINLSYIIVVVILIIDSATGILDVITAILKNPSDISDMLGGLYKGALICVLTKISSDVCKESGNMVVSDIIDIAGRIMLLIISYPFIISIIKTASAFVV